MSDQLFLHICCAPCACYTVDFFSRSGTGVRGFWFNPNIHPLAEHSRRREALDSFSRQSGLDLEPDGGYDVAEWFEATRPGWSAGNKELRCTLCYRFRLDRSAREAKKTGHTRFTSTLLYSRYQSHETIAETGRDLGRIHGIEFVYEDLRKGWQKGIEISKSMGLYRQRYCGCLFSEIEANRGKERK